MDESRGEALSKLQAFCGRHGPASGCLLSCRWQHLPIARSRSRGGCRQRMQRRHRERRRFCLRCARLRRALASMSADLMPRRRCRHDIEAVPESYFEDCERAGNDRGIRATRRRPMPRTAAGDGRTFAKTCNVYLPYGYSGSGRPGVRYPLSPAWGRRG
jgi:hypothetical protein